MLATLPACVVERVDDARIDTTSVVGSGAAGRVPVDSLVRTVIDTAAGDDMAALTARRLIVPVQGVAASAIVSSFNDARGTTRRHEALDILAPRGTPVLAADDGRVLKLYTSKAGGLTMYQADPTGRFIYYYAHMDGYRAGLQEGARVTRGDVVGYVGTTGNASGNTPHLHFAVSRADGTGRWWTGTPVDPAPALRGGR